MTALGPITREIARHVAGARFDALPAATVQAARRVLLDASGVMLAASGLSDDVRPFVELARRQGGAPEATILGHRERVPAALAAFANGAMAHALDYEDAFDRAPVHPNAASIPALLALAESRAPVSGADLLTAIVVGCDVACRLGLAAGTALEAAGWYPPPILGAFGATAAAARLLHLDERQVADAFSLLLLQNSAPAQIRHASDGVLRAVREAVPAQAAVQCALLAELGVRGFDAPLEGPGGFFEAFGRGAPAGGSLLDGLGRHWLIDELSFKPWPSCRGTHAAIELALRLRREQGRVAAEATHIVVGGGPVQSMLAEPAARKQAPPTAIEAKFSLPFTIATALVHGNVGLDHFGARALRDGAVLRVASRVRFERCADWGADRAASARLSVQLRDGRTRDAELPEPLGSPARPLDDAALVRKFVECAARAAQPWPEARAVVVAQRILALAADADASRPLDGAPPPV